MKYYKLFKSFSIEFIISFSLFSIIYPSAVVLTDLKFKNGDILMGIIISILIAVARVMTKEKNEETQEFIRSNYWKLKNELNRKVSGNKKRNNSK